jgi:hypothetical protein
LNDKIDAEGAPQVELHLGQNIRMCRVRRKGRDPRRAEGKVNGHLSILGNHHDLAPT